MADIHERDVHKRWRWRTAEGRQSHDVKTTCSLRHLPFIPVEHVTRSRDVRGWLTSRVRIGSQLWLRTSSGMRNFVTWLRWCYMSYCWPSARETGDTVAASTMSKHPRLLSLLYKLLCLIMLHALAILRTMTWVKSDFNFRPVLSTLWLASF